MASEYCRPVLSSIIEAIVTYRFIRIPGGDILLPVGDV